MTTVQTRLTDFWRGPPVEEKLNQPDLTNQNTQITKKVNIIQLNVCSLSELKASLITQLAIETHCSVLCLSEIGHRRQVPGYRCIAASDTHTQSGIFVHHDVLNCERVFVPTLQHTLARISSQCILINNLFIIHVYIPHKHLSRTDGSSGRTLTTLRLNTTDNLSLSVATSTPNLHSFVIHTVKNIRIWPTLSTEYRGPSKMMEGQHDTTTH
jgi:hypothetical protein